MSLSVAPTPMTDETDFERFAASIGLRLRRAFVARYGVELGTEAHADAMAYAWSHWPRVRTMANPAGYLYRVGQSSVRRQVRWRRHADLPTEFGSPDSGESDPALHDALAKLRRNQRTAVVLVHAHGYRYEEAAALMNVPVTTLRNYVNRGMAKLRSLMEEPT